MNPAFLDSMSWRMAEVYAGVNDEILINMSRYFSYFGQDNFPRSTFEYQARMLAQMGQVNRDTLRIIRRNLRSADGKLRGVLEQSIIDAVAKDEPSLLKAVKAGILKPAGIPMVSPQQSRAFQLYYQQSCDKLNMVNTVMLESTQQAYQATVSDIVNRVSATQGALNIATGETVTGVSSWNQAVKHATDRLKVNGITGFIDHAGRHWSAEAYVAMDIRTTVYNTARSAIWETNQDFGNDLYLVSYHNGARPLCYDWQNKVISSTDNERDTFDLDNNPIHVYAQSSTTYGEAAGLFGINCKHYPTPFIPGVTVIRGEPQNPEENERTYKESQEQRRLERQLREDKRDLAMMKAQGAPEDAIKAQQEKVHQSSRNIDEFCEQTGRTRQRSREGVYTGRSFPDPSTYDVTTFERNQKDMIEKYFRGGGAQQGYTFGQMMPNTPIVPNSTPTPAAVPQTPPQTQKISEKGEKLLFRLEDVYNIDRVKVERYAVQPTEREIINKIAGADKTGGSCSSCALAYAANKSGLDVTDFRGGMSRKFFASMGNIKEISELEGLQSTVVSGTNDFTNAHNLLKEVVSGKEYYFTAGKHAAIVRKSETGYEYLEMQSGWRENTWYELNDLELKRRFGCQRSHTTYGMKYEVSEVLIDVESFKGNRDFEEIVEFINTPTERQMKGAGGGEK